MADKTGISWTNATWNPITGCTKVSPGCKHCYALRDWPRMSANPKTIYFGRDFGDVQCHPERLEQPILWSRPRLIFVNSMSDLFHAKVPDAFIDQVFAVASLAPQHTFQVLTKRADRMQSYFSDPNVWARIETAARVMHTGRTGKQIVGKTLIGPLTNVWLGVSVENQEMANERVPHLMGTPAAVRWISAEPLLGPVDLNATPAGDVLCSGAEQRLQWIVTGGESGPNARPMHPAWARELRDQCMDAGVPFFFKQWGEWCAQDVVWSIKAHRDVVYLWENGDSLSGELSAAFGARNGATTMQRLGKAVTGELLDGVVHHAWPGQVFLAVAA